FSFLLYELLSRELHRHLDQAVMNSARTAAAGFQGQMLENQNDPVVATAHTLIEFRPHNTYLAVLTTERQLGAHYYNEMSMPTAEPVLQEPIAATWLQEAKTKQTPVLQTVTGFGTTGGRLAVTQIPDSDFFIVVAQSRAEVLQHLAAMRRIFYLSLPLMLLIAGLAGFFLAKKSLAPVAAMTEQVETINAHNLHERLQVSNPRDELGRLANVFNALLERVNRSFASLREFTADASHELRTPLAIIRGEADVALSQPRTAVEYQETLAIVRDEARRLSRIVDDMLALARADAGGHQLNREELYLNDLVEECCRSVQTLAAHKNIAVDCESLPDIEYCGDEELLRRMILNLLDNAIKYTPGGGRVRVALHETPAHIQLRVIDNGIGIPAEAAAHVFDRFYRVDRARSRAEGGSGLGLPIVKWVAEAHQGTVHLESLPGSGSEFLVELPRQ
ncbi:MAG TPA: ATP-binding protein, partial [Blastocatellia bacterium]|nr:ATP-binding protein [Blastocatellia bacterium]